MSEELLIQHCAPTLAGLKTGSLVTAPCPDVPAVLAQLRQWNRAALAEGRTNFAPAVYPRACAAVPVPVAPVGIRPAPARCGGYFAQKRLHRSGNGAAAWPS